MTAAPSIPPVLDTRHAKAYRRHLEQVYAPLLLAAMREMMQRRLDEASALEAEWEIEKRRPCAIVGEPL